MKENYTDKVDKVVTELKKQDFILVGVIVDVLREFLPLKRSEIRTAFIYAGLKPPREDIKFIYEQLEVTR